MNTTSAKALKSAQRLNLVYIIGTYPRLTTTFIDREICSLRQRGVNLTIFSIRRPSESLPDEQVDLQKGVTYLLPISVVGFVKGQLRLALRYPRKYISTLSSLFSAPHTKAKSRLMTLFHFAEGVAMADLISKHLGDQSPDHLHAHFVDRAATVTLVASRLLNIPYSLTAHANDIFVDPQLLPEKINGAKFVATCTQYNQNHLSQIMIGKFDDKVKCIYHGINFDQYRPRSNPANGEPVLLAVGQLKEKKGFRYLIRACKILMDRGLGFRCEIVGDGPLHNELETEIRSLSMEGTISLCGALPHQEVVQKFRESDIFVMPSILSSDGDRDGIPNVILEAMAMQLPVVSTSHSGIPEVIEDGTNGLLVPPADEVALAKALQKLIVDNSLCVHLGLNGRGAVMNKFDIQRNVTLLLSEFTLS